LRIVILGAGSIGGSVANELSSEENDIIVIDNNEQNLDKVKGKEGYRHSWKCFVPQNPLKSRPRQPNSIIMLN
jgi:saccharopine dehydrogenase-like NADP-dependent oxidoreductase